MMSLTLALMLTLGVAQTFPRPPQAPPAQGATAPAGTAVIRGTVTAADTGKPLRRAQVRISAPEAGENRTTSTNIRGEYEIKDLAAGRYSITVTRSGYLSMQHGQRQYGELGQPLQVDEGRTVERIDFALPRAGVISGRLVDETGEPVASVNVWVMRHEYFRGRRRLVTMGPAAITDDVGHYRAGGLPPGEYMVMALLRHTWVAGPEKHTYGYAPSYFPGTASPADALRVKVAPSQETPNVDFALVAARAATLSGTAHRADGSPLGGASVGLSQEVAGPTFSSSFGGYSSTVSADGSWIIKNVPPGEYTVEATSRDRGRAQERASVPIVVQGTEMPGIALVTNAGGTISGQVVTDDGQPLPTAPVRLRVMAETVGPDSRGTFFVSGDDNGQVADDGTFRLSGVIGPALVRLIPPLPGWRVKQVEIGGDDYSLKPLQPKSGENVSGIRIVLTNKFPAVSGRVTDAEARPIEGVVVLIPEDESTWMDGGMLRSARPDQTGVYRIDAVRPGDYLAVALETVQSWQLQDPEFLSTLRDAATRVTVREGAPVQLDLRVRR